MKKMKKIKIMLFFLLIAGTIRGCDDFLSELPDNRTQLDSPEKISEVLVNAYPQGNYMEFAETMSDNVFDNRVLSSTDPTNTQNFNWEFVQDTEQDTPAFYWEACYNAIAHANQALEAIKQLNYDPKLNPQRGEALLCRAYAHFMLVTFFSQRYDPATAPTALGIPYVLEPEDVLFKKYTRNTIAEVYNYIQQDLEEGLKYVTNDYKEPKFHFNRAAANAFASRFYLMKGDKEDWDKVLTASNTLGNTPVAALRDWTAFNNLLDFNTKVIAYGAANLPTNLLISSTQSWYRRTVRGNRFAFTQEVAPQFLGTNTNLFNKVWIYSRMTYSSGGGLTSFLPKFNEYFKYSNISAGIGRGYVNIVLLSNDEFFLNRIEAHVMKGDFVLANQELTYFLSLRLYDDPNNPNDGYNPATDIITTDKITTKYPVIPNEYTPHYTLTPVQASYIKALAEIRRREFIHEGVRWFDIKRFNLVVTHQAVNQPANVLTKDDPRRAIQIPLAASNAGLEKNPR